MRMQFGRVIYGLSLGLDLWSLSEKKPGSIWALSTQMRTNAVYHQCTIPPFSSLETQNHPPPSLFKTHTQTHGLCKSSSFNKLFSNSSLIHCPTQVTASAWLNDLRNQIEQTRILSTVYRSASALGSRLPSIASAKARVVGAGAYLRPVSKSTQVYRTLRNEQNVAYMMSKLWTVNRHRLLALYMGYMITMHAYCQVLMIWCGD